MRIRKCPARNKASVKTELFLTVLGKNFTVKLLVFVFPLNSVSFLGGWLLHGVSISFGSSLNRDKV